MGELQGFLLRDILRIRETGTSSSHLRELKINLSLGEQDIVA